MEELNTTSTVTTPVEPQVQPPVTDEVKPQATPAPAETQQLDAVSQLVESQDLPKGTTYFKDDNGKLQFIVPIDGKNYQVDFAGLVKGFNLNQAGYKRLEEGKTLLKQFEGFIDKLRKDPNELWAFAERVGLDPVKLAEGRLQRAVEEASMTDEQKELAKVKKEKEDWIKEKEAHTKSMEDQKMAMESEKYQAKYSNDLIEALKKHGISADKQSFVSMKGIAREAVKKVTAALERGVDMSMEDAVTAARQEVDAYIQDFLMSVDDNHIIDALPAEFVNRILKASLNKKVGTPTTNTVGKPVVLKETGNQPKKGKKVPIGDYFRNLK